MSGSNEIINSQENRSTQKDHLASVKEIFHANSIFDALFKIITEIIKCDKKLELRLNHAEFAFEYFYGDD